MTHAFLGRQPILDRQLKVFGHELLFRSGEANRAQVLDGDQATAAVVVNAFVEFGIERVVGPAHAFVNITREFLLAEEPPPFPPDRVIMEILEDEVVDDALVAAVRGLTKAGYRFALDDFVFDPRWEPLLPLASVVKVEVPALDDAGLAEHIRLLRCYDLHLLAEKVETKAEFEHLRELGFDLFQGYFFARPEVLQGQRIPDNRMATLRLLACLQKSDADIDEIESVVSQDVGLSYKLLRFINSASVGLPRKVDSIHRAVVLMGLGPLKRIATLAAMAGQSDKPSELMRVALVRARMCELLCADRVGLDGDSGFTVGLFSTLESLMDAPFADILAKVPLAEEVTAALLDSEGPLGEILNCALAYERCDWPRATCNGTDIEAISGAYTEAVQWSYETGGGLLG